MSEDCLLTPIKGRQCLPWGKVEGKSSKASNWSWYAWSPDWGLWNWYSASPSHQLVRHGSQISQTCGHWVRDRVALRWVIEGLWCWLVGRVGDGRGPHYWADPARLCFPPCFLIVCLSVRVSAFTMFGFGEYFFTEAVVTVFGSMTFLVSGSADDLMFLLAQKRMLNVMGYHVQNLVLEPPRILVSTLLLAFFPPCSFCIFKVYRKAPSNHIENAICLIVEESIDMSIIMLHMFAVLYFLKVFSHKLLFWMFLGSLLIRL